MDRWLIDAWYTGLALAALVVALLLALYIAAVIETARVRRKRRRMIGRGSEPTCFTPYLRD